MLQTLTRSQFSTAISCMGCGKPGQVIWEESSQPNRHGPLRTLIAMPLGFRQGAVQPSRDPAIICEDCGTAQQD